MKVQTPIIVSVKFQKPLVLSDEDREFLATRKPTLSKLKDSVKDTKNAFLEGFHNARNRPVYPY